MAKKKSKRRAKCTVRVGKSRLKYSSFIKRKSKTLGLKKARAAWKKATKGGCKASTKRKTTKRRRKHKSKR